MLNITHLSMRNINYYVMVAVALASINFLGFGTISFVCSWPIGHILMVSSCLYHFLNFDLTLLDCFPFISSFVTSLFSYFSQLTGFFGKC